MALKIMQNVYTKISKYVVIMDPKLGTNWIEALQNVVSDFLLMEPRKEVGLDKFHIIAIIQFKNPVWDTSLMTFFTKSEVVLKDLYCYPIKDNFG